MANFMEFIRYGLPGYLFLASVVFALFRRGLLPNDYKFYNDFGTIIGASLIVIGPLFGFIIHQLYFLYFDVKESYTKQTRGCLKLLFDYYLNNHQEFEKSKAKTKQLCKAAYVTWKFLMTGMDETFKVSSLFLTRLTSLRNYSHAFGGIITASTLSLAVYVLVVWNQTSLRTRPSIAFFIIHGFILMLFGYKRHELSARIVELENGIMILRLKEFSAFLENLLTHKANLETPPSISENCAMLMQESQVVVNHKMASPSEIPSTSPTVSQSSR